MKTNNITNNSDSTLSIYLKEISKKQLLSAEEENIIILLAQSGNEKARDILVETNLRFVVKIAKQFKTSSLDLEDLISEGNLGLITAIDKFDTTKGYKFISYAVWWIRQSIMKAINDTGSLIRLPLNRTNDLIKIKKAQNQYFSETGHDASIETLASLVDMEEDVIETLLSSSQEISSLDAALSSDGQSTFTDLLPDDSFSSEELILQDALKDDINTVLSKLKDREREVLVLRYGLNNNPALSLNDIGNKFNLTKERIRQIENRALSKISTSDAKVLLSNYHIA